MTQMLVDLCQRVFHDAADQNQRKDEQEQPIVYNEDAQPIKLLIHTLIGIDDGMYVKRERNK